MTDSINLQTVQQEYLKLRDTMNSVQIATLDANGLPEASYAPFVWADKSCYLFLSQLARHTQNLSINPSISLLVIEDEASSKNQFARKRIIWYGEAEAIERQSSEFTQLLDGFRQRFGNFIDIIEPLPDFILFKICPHSGRFIRGFAQAYTLAGDDLSEITQINPAGGKSS